MLPRVESDNPGTACIELKKSNVSNILQRVESRPFQSPNFDGGTLES